MKQLQKGIICILGSAFCFAWMNAFVRMAGDLPSMQKSFFRNLVALLFAFIVIIKNNTGFRFTRQQLPYLIFRAGFGTIGIICNFYAIDHLVISDASMLNKMSPFFAIILSYLFLKEKANAVQWIGVAVAFLGSLLIIKPTFANMDLVPSLIGLLGGLGAGAAYTCVRHLAKLKVKGPFIVFFFSAFSCIVLLPFVLTQYEPMTGNQLLCLLGAGGCAAGGQFCITAAYSFAPAKDISVYDYSQVVFAAILGFIFFNQIPDIWSVLGYVIICSTAVAIFLYSKQHGEKA